MNSGLSEGLGALSGGSSQRAPLTGSAGTPRETFLRAEGWRRDPTCLTLLWRQKHLSDVPSIPRPQQQRNRLQSVCAGLGWPGPQFGSKKHSVCLQHGATRNKVGFIAVNAQTRRSRWPELEESGDPGMAGWWPSQRSEASQRDTCFPGFQSGKATRLLRAGQLGPSTESGLPNTDRNEDT